MRPRIAVVYHWLPLQRIVLGDGQRATLFLADVNRDMPTQIGGDQRPVCCSAAEPMDRSLSWQRGLLGFLVSRRNRSNCFSGGSSSTWTASLFRRRVTIGWTHGLSKHESTLQRKLKLLFYKRFSHIWTYSEDAATHLRALNLDALAVYNSNGVATRLNPSQEGNKDLLFGGRVLEERKLAEAISFLFFQNNSSSPHIVGNGPDIPQLKRLAADHGSRSSRVSRRHLQRNRTCDDCTVLQPLSPPHRHRSFCAHCLETWVEGVHPFK